MSANAEEKLIKMGIKLDPPRAAGGNYVGFIRTGSLLFIAGQICMTSGGEIVSKGQLDASSDLEKAIAGARCCGINILSQVKVALGSLDRVKRVVRLGGFVNSTPGFIDGPKVVNGASDLMVEVFGEIGRHARTAVGVAALPLDVSVEVDAIFEVE
jgi:enamine deaminase RidA (YjgF/YER057c/UK114 family)